MKKAKLSTELITWAIALIPLVYLWIMWEQLPERVPVHFNLQGEANGWASKPWLVGITLFTTVGINLIMLLIPAIDPKKRIEGMGDKYVNLRLILVLFMSALSLFIVHSAASENGLNHNIMLVLIGTLFAALGNYFQAVKPNYFIGIRTPWTLESENVWRKTHRVGGRLWLIGGILMALLPLISDNALRETIFLSIVAVIVVIPVLYSFLEFKREQVAR